MNNEDKIVELLSDMLVKQDEMVANANLESRVAKLEKVVFK